MGTKKESVFLVAFSVSPATSEQSVTHSPEVSDRSRMSVGHQWGKEIQWAGCVDSLFGAGQPSSPKLNIPAQKLKCLWCLPQLLL